MNPEILWWIAPVAAVLSLIFAIGFYKWMIGQSEGNATMKEIAQHVREGAYAYLYAQYKVVGRFLLYYLLYLRFLLLSEYRIHLCLLHS